MLKIYNKRYFFSLYFSRSTVNPKKISKRINDEKIAEEAKKLKTSNENIENSKPLDQNEIANIVVRKAIKFINLFHKSFYEFHENRMKREGAGADADLDSGDGVISDILSKNVIKNRSPINLDKEERKENEEGKEPSLSDKKTNFLKVIDNFFPSFFNSAKKTAA